MVTPGGGQPPRRRGAGGLPRPPRRILHIRPAVARIDPFNWVDQRAYNERSRNLCARLSHGAGALAQMVRAFPSAWQRPRPRRRGDPAGRRHHVSWVATISSHPPDTNLLWESLTLAAQPTPPPTRPVRVTGADYPLRPWSLCLHEGLCARKKMRRQGSIVTTAAAISSGTTWLVVWNRRSPIETTYLARDCR